MITNKMWKHFVILIILKIIHMSVQQSCKVSCFSDTSDKNCVKKYEIRANAKIHETRGIVDFQFDFECNIQTYNIVIFYNREKCSDFMYHSTYNFEKIQNFYKINITNLEKCSKTGRVFLQNIQTGCYKIDILNEESDIVYKNISYWKTSYLRQKIDLLKTRVIHDSRNNGTELIFKIENPILNSHPEFSLQFECKNCPKYFNSEHSYFLIQDKINPDKMILGPKDNNSYLNISCNLEQNISASCYISPVTVGHYNIVVTFVGEPFKCGFYQPEDHKIRINNIVIKADEILEQPPNYFDSIMHPLLGVTCILLSFSVVILIIKLGKNYIRILNKNSKINQENTNINLGEIKIKPSILLLYARNSEVEMEILSSFRNIFLYQGIQVFDIHDPERLNEINENHFSWILNLTSRKNIKIIVFLTPSARNLSNLPQIQNSIDNIYPFAMKHLLSKISNDKEFHEKIFVAHFSNDLKNYSDYDLFCPHLRFRVPEDFLILLQSILKTGHIFLNNKANNELCKLKGNCEKVSWKSLEVM